MANRRQYTQEVKLEILQQLRDKSVVQVAKEKNLHPMVIYKWKREHEINPVRAFAGHGKICKLEAEIANYQRLVGKLCAQNDFLKKM